MIYRRGRRIRKAEMMKALSVGAVVVIVLSVAVSAAVLLLPSAESASIDSGSPLRRAVEAVEVPAGAQALPGVAGPRVALDDVAPAVPAGADEPSISQQAVDLPDAPSADPAASVATTAPPPPPGPVAPTPGPAPCTDDVGPTGPCGDSWSGITANCWDGPRYAANGNPVPVCPAPPEEDP